MAVVLMSKAELSRVDTLARVDRGELPVAGAASLLGLSPRQVFRLLARFRAGGASRPRPPPARPAEQPAPAGRGARGRARGRARALRRLRPDARGREAGGTARHSALAGEAAAVDERGRALGAAQGASWLRPPAPPPPRLPGRAGPDRRLRAPL